MMVNHVQKSRKENNHCFVSSRSDPVSHQILNYTLSKPSYVVKRIPRRIYKPEIRHLSNGMKQSTGVIHINIRPSNTTSLKENRVTKLNPSFSLTNQSSTKTNIQHDEADSQKVSVISGLVSDDKTELGSSNVTGVRTNIHSDSNDYKPISKTYQKKICLYGCIITSIIIMITLLIVLPITLIKPKITTTFSLIPVLRWNQTGSTIFGQSGVPGNSNNQLHLPRDVLWDHPNVLYIADTLNHRIQKYLIDDSNGVTLAGQANGTGGSLTNQLNSPSYVQIDSSKGLYVADTQNSRVQFWSSGASSGITIVGNSTNAPFNTSYQLNTPYGIFRDSNSATLYIADYGNSRVLSYVSGASSSTIVAGGNGAGKSSIQFDNLIRLYFDSSANSLIVANHYAHNIVRWVLGDTSWTLLAGDVNGNPGSNSTQLRYPSDVTFDPMGNMYIADKDNHRIQLFMLGQTEGITIAGVTNISGSNSSLLYQPWSVVLDSQLNLYVADTGNHRIQKFLRY